MLGDYSSGFDAFQRTVTITIITMFTKDLCYFEAHPKINLLMLLCRNEAEVPLSPFPAAVVSEYILLVVWFWYLWSTSKCPGKLPHHKAFGSV